MKHFAFVCMQLPMHAKWIITDIGIFQNLSISITIYYYLISSEPPLVAQSLRRGPPVLVVPIVPTCDVVFLNKVKNNFKFEYGFFFKCVNKRE